VHLLVNELCEYQNARCNDKKNHIQMFKHSHLGQRTVNCTAFCSHTP